MLLTIDVGNTNTVLGVFDAEELVHSWRVKTDPRDTADELWLRYRSLIEGYTVTGLAVCSTVPSVLREIRTMIGLYFQDIPTTLIEPGVKTGVPLLVDFPKEIGTVARVHQRYHAGRSSRATNEPILLRQRRQEQYLYFPHRLSEALTSPYGS